MASVRLTGKLKFPENINKEDSSDKRALQNWTINLRKLFSTHNPEIFIESTDKFMESNYTIASSKAYLDQISVLRMYFKSVMNLLTDDSLNIFICKATKWIIEKIIDRDHSSWCLKRELLKCVNAILRSKRMSIIYFITKIVKDMPPDYLCKMLDSLNYYGDFDMQATILETIFAIYGKKRIIASLELIPDSTELRQDIAEIKENTFHKDCRTFLNIINKKQKNIFSLQCMNIQINGSAYVISVDDDNGIWVDFNLLKNSLSWYQKTDSDQSWELITLFASEVDTAFLGASTENRFVITLELAGCCVSSISENQDTVNQIKLLDIIVKRSVEGDELISKVLPKILSKKFKKPRTNGKTFYNRTYQPLSIKVEKRVKYRELKDTSNVSQIKGLNPISFGSISNVSSSFSVSRRLSSDFEEEEFDITSTDDPNKEYLSEEILNSRNTLILAGRCTNKSFNYREIMRSQDDSFQDVRGTRRTGLSSTVLCEKDENKTKETNRGATKRNFDVAVTTENKPQWNTDQYQMNENMDDPLIVSEHQHTNKTFVLSDDVYYSCPQLVFANDEENEGIHSGATKKMSKKSQQVGKTTKNCIDKPEGVVQPSMNFEEQVICTLDAITETNRPSQNSNTQYFSLSPTGGINVKDPVTLSPPLSENDDGIVAPKLQVKKPAEINEQKMNKNDKKLHQRDPLEQINTIKKGNRDGEVDHQNISKMQRSLVVASQKKLERENNRSPKISKRNKKIDTRKVIRKPVIYSSEDEVIVISDDDDSEADDLEKVNEKTEAPNVSVETKQSKKLRGKKGNESEASQICKDKESEIVDEDYIEKTDVTKSKKINTKSTSSESAFDEEREKMFEADIRKIAACINEAENQVDEDEDNVEKTDVTKSKKINTKSTSSESAFDEEREKMFEADIRKIAACMNEAENQADEDNVEKTDVTKSKKMKTKSTSSESAFDEEREKMFEADIRKIAACINEAENQIKIAAPVEDAPPNINIVNDGQVVLEELDGSQIKHETLDDEDVIATTTKTKTTTSQVQCNSPLQEDDEQNRKTDNVEEEFDGFNKILGEVQSNEEDIERSLATKSGKNRLSNIKRSTKSKKTVISEKLSKRNAKGIENKKSEPTKLVKTGLRRSRNVATGKKRKGNGKKVPETVQVSTTSNLKKKSAKPNYDAIEIAEEREHHEVDNIVEETEDDIAAMEEVKSKETESNSIPSAPKREPILETEKKEMVVYLNKENTTNNVSDTIPKNNTIDGCETIQEDARSSQTNKQSNEDVMMNIVITATTKKPSSPIRYSSTSQESPIFENKEIYTPVDFDKVFDALKNTPKASRSNYEDIERCKDVSIENSQSQNDKHNASFNTVDLNELTRSQQIQMIVTHNRTKEDDVIIQKRNKSLEKSVDLSSDDLPKTRTQPKRKCHKRYVEETEEITTAFEDIPEAISSVDDVVERIDEITEKKSTKTVPKVIERPSRKSNKQYEEEMSPAFEEIPSVDNLDGKTEEKLIRTLSETRVRHKRKSNKRYVEETEEITVFEDMPEAMSSVDDVVERIDEITEKKSNKTVPKVIERPKRKSNKQCEDEMSPAFEEISSVDVVHRKKEETLIGTVSETRARPKRKSNKRYVEETEEITVFEDMPEAMSSVDDVVDRIDETTVNKSTKKVPKVIERPRRKSNKQYEEEMSPAFEEISTVDVVHGKKEEKLIGTASETRARPKRKSNKRNVEETEEITAFEDIPETISSVDDVVDRIDEITEKKSTKTVPKVIERPRKKSNKQYEEEMSPAFEEISSVDNLEGKTEEKLIGTVAETRARSKIKFNKQCEEITTAPEEIPKAISSDQNNEIVEKISSEKTPEIRTRPKKNYNKPNEEEITTAPEEIPKAISSVENVIEENNEITENMLKETTPESRIRPKRKFNKQYEEITTVFEEIPKAISSVGRKRRKLYDNTMVMLPSPEEKNEARGLRGIEKIPDQSTTLADISTNNGTFNHGYTKQISDKKYMNASGEVERNVEEINSTLKKVDRKKPRRSKYEVTYSEEEAKEEAFRKKCRNIVRANTMSVDDFYKKKAKQRKYSLGESKLHRHPITSRNYDVHFSLDRSEWTELQYILDSERRHSDGKISSAKGYLKKKKSTIRKSSPKKEAQKNYPTKKKINIISNICVKPRNNQNIPQDTDQYEEMENSAEAVQSINYNFQRVEENVPKAVLTKGFSWTASAFFEDEYITINFEDFIGKYLVLFFYPFDFGELPNVFPPTEINFFNKHFEEFQQLNTNILGCSVDSIYTHKVFVNELHTNNHSDRMKFPLIGDTNHQICKGFNVLNHNSGHSYRAIIIIDQKGEVTVKTVVEVNLEMVLDDVLKYIKYQTVSSI